MSASETPTEADFADCSTHAQHKRHWYAKSWPKATLCGNRAEFHLEAWTAHLPECKQCVKSKRRQIEGRPH